MATASSACLRGMRRSLHDTRWASRLTHRPLTTASSTTTGELNPTPVFRNRAHPLPSKDIPTTPKRPELLQKRARKAEPPPPIPSAEPRKAPTKPDKPYTEAQLHPSIPELLPLLRGQPPHYLRIHIHGKPYLVTQGDQIRLPFLMHGVEPGDVLRLNRASLLGSRDYTLRAGAPEPDKWREAKYLDERLFTCRATVLGVELEPLRIKEKTKRRQRHIKRVKSKHSYTILRVSEVSVSRLESLAGDASAAERSPAGIPGNAPGGLAKVAAGAGSRGKRPRVQRGEMVEDGAQASYKQEEIIPKDKRAEIEESMKQTVKIEV